MPYQIDLMQFPSWFMATAIVVLCWYTGRLHKRQEKSMEKRDALIDTIAKAIYGKGGLETRTTVMENNFNRCNGCNETYKEHRREHEEAPHVHVRADGQTHMKWNRNGSMERINE